MAGPLTKAGRYEIVAELGRGSMGVVYQGFDPIIGRTVAIKTMLIDSLPPSEFEEYKQRFQREAQAAGILTHPNIVTVYDFGEDSGVLFLAMEFLEGKSLQDLVEKHNIMPVETLIPMYEQICSALDHAHQHKIVHRDVKPANIMILDSGLVKVTDFGIAKVMSMGMTQAGQILGTPNYMSPEQVKGRQVDGRSDIFSLGVILYELVTGEKPFGGQNITTVIYKIINEDPIPPRQLDATIHPGLSFVISKALAKNPEERYQTCRELAEDLRNYKNLGSMGAPNATLVMRVPAVQAQPAVAMPQEPQKPAVRQPRMAPPPQRTAPPQLQSVAEPTFDPVVSPSYPQTAPQPRPAPVAPPRFATAQPAQKGSSSLAWAFIVVLLLAGLGVGGFYYYTNIYVPQQKAAQNNPPLSVTPATQPNTPSGGTKEPQNPNATSTSTPGNSPPSPTTSPTTQPGGTTTVPDNSQAVKPEVPKPTEPKRENPQLPAPVSKNGRVEVSSNVRGADIIVDGRGTGLVTPHSLELTPGSHEVTVTMDGYTPSKATIEVESGKTVKKRIELAEEVPIPTPKAPTPIDTSTQGQGSVEIVTTPAGIPISFDGVSKGNSPVTTLLTAGKHTYTFTCPYAEATTKSITVTAGAIATYTIHCSE